MTARTKLKAHLERTGRTQRSLAAATGIDEPTISRYLTGERVPTLAHASAIEREIKSVRATEWVD